jgi:hypothetical protein
LAVACCAGLFSLAYFLNIITHNMLFEMAGANYFFSYILAVIVYLKVMDSPFSKVIGILSLLLTVIFYINMGSKGIYPILLFTGGYIFSIFRTSLKTCAR